MIMRDLGGEAERQAALAAATPTLHASPLPPLDEPTAEPTELALPFPTPPPAPQAAEPPRSPPPPIQLNAPPPATPLLRQDGRVYSVPDIATLQRWILERRVTAEDQVNLTGDGWQPVQTQPELEVFFRTLARLDDLEYRQAWSGDPQPSVNEPWEPPPAPTVESRGRESFSEDDGPMSLGGITEEHARGVMGPLARTQEAPWRGDGGYNAISDSIQETVEIRHGGLRPVDDSDIGEPTEIAQPFTRDPTDEIAPAAIFVPSKPAESPFAQAMGPSLEASDTATTTLRELSAEPRLLVTPRPAAVEQEEVELPPMRDEEPEELPAAGASWGTRLLFGAALALLLGIGWWSFRPSPNPTTPPAAPIPEAAGHDASTPPPEATPTTPPAEATPTTPAPDPTKAQTTPSEATPTKATKAPATTPTTPKPAPAADPASCASAKACADLGWKAIGTGDYSLGRIMFIEALAIDPKNADAHYGMGYAALRQGDTATALRKFCQARQYAGNNAELAREVDNLITANNGTCD